MSSKAIRFLVATAIATLVSACGGGGGGGVGSISPPPPAPPPPPPPPPPTPATFNLFPSVTTNTSFAVLGYEVNGRYTASPTLTGDGFAVSYDATTKLYRIDVPYAPPGDFRYYGGVPATSYGGCLNDCTPAVTLANPVNLDPALEYVTVASYYNYDWGGSEPAGYFAFGIPTTPGNVPVTGTASYKSTVLGSTVDPGYDISGTASMQFDFGAGTLAGTLSPTLVYYTNGPVRTDLPAYTFVNTVFGVGSTSWSGELSTSGAPSNGIFNGQFMGPTATELMARFRSPYYNPVLQRWSTMFGVWAGKKQ